LQKPSALLKASSMPAVDKKSELTNLHIPTKRETINRIHKEFEDRGKLDVYLKKLIASIPDQGPQSIEKVSAMLVMTFAFVRNYVADELELFSISFFQLPMFRKLESDMHCIELDKSAQQEAAERRANLETRIAEQEKVQSVVQACVRDIKTFRACCI